MGYKSPVEMFSQISDIVEYMHRQQDEYICRAIMQLGINVDKEELIKALAYDRGQYEKGYHDGYDADKWISVESELPNCNKEDDVEVLVFIKGAMTATTLYYSNGVFF